MASDNDWGQRQLCPDGDCIGVIGPDGTCKVCGRAAPGWGDERKRGLRDDAAAEVEREVKREEREVAISPPAAADFEDRALCPDGSCIGLIGDDGRCKVCGRAAAS